MKIKYKNKPSQELINKYSKKLEEFLSAHNITISIELFDFPLRLEMYENNNLTEITNIWIKEIKIKGSKICGLLVDLFDEGIDENLDKHKIWTNAWYIQDQIYKKLNLTPISPNKPDYSNEPYWKLWDHLKDFK